MRFQNGALEVLMALLEMARRLRGEAVQLKVSFKKGPCKQFRCIVEEGGLFFHGTAVSITMTYSRLSER
jgi:hypothetical protein